MEKIYLAAIALVVIVYVMLRILRNRPDLEFQRYYNDILNSDKYKVKGRHE
ncbi:hypothetical protein KY320_02150 [Candidatus Woesearchaeota archaeon]|nr:hypothetical protein [Candidatus Woesearchaeota archaeon]